MDFEDKMKIIMGLAGIAAVLAAAYAAYTLLATEHKLAQSALSQAWRIR